MCRLFSYFFCDVVGHKAWGVSDLFLFILYVKFKTRTNLFWFISWSGCLSGQNFPERLTFLARSIQFHLSNPCNVLVEENRKNDRVAAKKLCPNVATVACRDN